MAGRRTRRYRARGRIPSLCPLRAQARLRQLFRVSRPEVFLGGFVGEWSGRAAKGPGLAATHPWFRRGRSRSAWVANGRLRQAGKGAVRRACSARRNGPPGGILPLRVCTVLPRGDPFVAVYGPATATCMPTPALSGSGVSPSIRPVFLLPATRQPVVCRTGFPTADRIQASVAMPRRVSNGGFAFHVRPWKLLVVAARFWRMPSTLGCQSRR